jgi:hypothetical protein
LALSVLVTALAIVFIASVFANPVLPSFNLKSLSALPQRVDLKDLQPKAPNLPANPSETKDQAFRVPKAPD